MAIIRLTLGSSEPEGFSPDESEVECSRDGYDPW
jgi:hypothetical protein